MAETPRPLSPKQVERLNAPATGTMIKWMSKAQTWLFKTTGGKLGNKFLRGAEVGILTTTGRKSGEPRDSPLLFLQEGRRIVLVASQGVGCAEVMRGDGALAFDPTQPGSLDAAIDTALHRWREGRLHLADPRAALTYDPAVAPHLDGLAECIAACLAG